MLGYIQGNLLRLQHDPPPHPKHVPYKYHNPTSSKHPPEPIPEDTSAPLLQPQMTRIQLIAGILLNYARTVEPILLTTLNVTVETVQSITKLLIFCTTYPNASLVFKASGVVLHVYIMLHTCPSSKNAVRQEDITILVTFPVISSRN